MSENISCVSAEEAIAKLRAGNEKYTASGANSGDVSESARVKTCNEGQHPYAVIIACSDSRVIPESIFQAGIGELFVIRVAGNVIDRHQLGSVEYALEHLGCKLVAVLGHDHCGAVDAALNHEPDGHIKYITDEIRKAIGDETDEAKACRLNVEHSVGLIERNLAIKKLEKSGGLKVIGAMYCLSSGKVEFFE